MVAGDYAPPRPPRVPASSCRSIILSTCRLARSLAATSRRIWLAQDFEHVADLIGSTGLPQQRQRSSSSLLAISSFGAVLAPTRRVRPRARQRQPPRGATSVGTPPSPTPPIEGLLMRVRS